MKQVLFTCTVLMAAWKTMTCAQSPPPTDPQPESESPRQQVVRSFDLKAPQIGQTLPEVKVVNSQGDEFSLASLRGKHTVLVFGCLT